MIYVYSKYQLWPCAPQFYCAAPISVQTVLELENFYYHSLQNFPSISFYSKTNTPLGFLGSIHDLEMKIFIIIFEIIIQCKINHAYNSHILINM